MLLENGLLNTLLIKKHGLLLYHGDTDGFIGECVGNLYFGGIDGGEDLMLKL
jgi:hypothetical protein